MNRYLIALLTAAAVLCFTGKAIAQKPAQDTIAILTPEVAQQFSVPEDIAAKYLQLEAAALRAEETAEKDTTETSRLKADFLRKSAFAYIAGNKMLIQGNKLIEKIGTGDPGVPLPQPHALEAKTFLVFAAQVMEHVLYVNVAGTKYAIAYATQSQECVEQRIASCQKKIEEALTLIRKEVDQAISASNLVMDLTKSILSRLTY